jgi:hypothetical protein
MVKALLILNLTKIYQALCRTVTTYNLKVLKSQIYKV